MAISNALRLEKLGKCSATLAEIQQASKEPKANVEFEIIQSAIRRLRKVLFDGIPEDQARTVQEGALYAESILGMDTKKGLVRMSYGISFDVLLSPAEARDYGGNLMAAAESAETDQLLWEWLGKSGVGIDDMDKRAVILGEFRKNRDRIQREAKVAED